MPGDLPEEFVSGQRWPDHLPEPTETAEDFPLAAFVVEMQAELDAHPELWEGNLLAGVHVDSRKVLTTGNHFDEVEQRLQHILGDEAGEMAMIFGPRYVEPNEAKVA